MSIECAADLAEECIPALLSELSRQQEIVEKMRRYAVTLEQEAEAMRPVVEAAEKKGHVYDDSPCEICKAITGYRRITDTSMEKPNE